MNLYQVEKMGKGNSYIAPDPHFISSILLFANSLPWVKFEKFFESKELISASATEQLTLLRLVALQEILCINDEALLKWTKNQLYLFGFMQPDFKPQLPSVKLLNEFRSRFDEVGLLKPFRKQCQRLIREQESRLPPISVDSEIEASTLQSQYDYNAYKISDIKVDLQHPENSSGTSCPNCGSYNIIQLAPSQVTSLPSISFSRCRFCGNTFRDDSFN